MPFVSCAPHGRAWRTSMHGRQRRGLTGDLMDLILKAACGGSITFRRGDYRWKISHIGHFANTFYKKTGKAVAKSKKLPRFIHINLSSCAWLSKIGFISQSSGKTMLVLGQHKAVRPTSFSGKVEMPTSQMCWHQGRTRIKNPAEVNSALAGGISPPFS
jgi:hypothetical protein